MVVEEHGNRLLITPDGFGEFFQILSGSARVGIGAIMLLFLAAKESLTDGVIALVIILIVGWFLISVFTVESAYISVFDKESQKFETVIRSPWTLWIPRKKIVDFTNLVSITLKKADGETLKLFLALKGDIWITFAGPANTNSAEKISGFLRIPLKIMIDDELITHIPWGSEKEGTPFPTPCAKCGAPLPIIKPGMMNVKCNHCGMTMFISWSEGRISYKAVDM